MARPEQKNVEGYAERVKKEARDEHASRRRRGPVAPTSIPAGYDKRLMVAAGRASQELGGKIAEQARRRA